MKNQKKNGNEIVLVCFMCIRRYRDSQFELYRNERNGKRNTIKLFGSLL